MKLTIFLLLVVTFSQCHASVANTLLKLTDILNAMNLKGMLEGSAAHKIGDSFFRYYSDDLLPLQFQLWKEHVGREYDSDDEHDYRKSVWTENVKYIHQHNTRNNTYTVAMNHLGDMTVEEYRKNMLGMRLTKKLPLGGVEVPLLLGLPRTVDWREHGYVTPVKNQGACGSCWSFSSTGAMEGANMNANGILVSLSEQNLVDCSSDYGNYGCNGGLMDNAFRYVIDNGGLNTEEAYPYEAEQDDCRYSANDTVIKLTGYKDVAPGSEAALKNALANVGPISVAIDASHRSFQFYHTGVYDEPECSSENLDHGVLTVGYGTEDGQDYWLVKNSWSSGWGEEGYVKMLRNSGNQCGVASAASYPIAAKLRN